MSLRETIAGRLTLPLHERLRRRATFRYLAELERRYAGSREDFDAWHREKLRRLLAHASREVPHYRVLFDAHGIGAPFSSETLEQVPLLDRDTIRADPESFVAGAWRGRLIRYNTGGSTGRPLVFYTDREREASLNAYKQYLRSWYGVRPGDAQVDLWGSPVEMDRQTRLRRWKDRYLLNQVVLSAFDLTEKRLAAYIRFINRFRPKLIYGYPTVIYRLARVVRQSGRNAVFSPKLVVCTAEMLFDHHRETIRQAFRCPVVNEYGARDGGLIAHECPHGAMHVAGGHVHVRIHAPDAEGVGDILVTNLDGYGFPLINYRIGDRGMLSGAECSCGKPGPLLATLAGRTNDFIVGRQGRLIHSLAPIYVLREIPGIDQFRIVQAGDLSLDIQLVANAGLSPDILESIRTQLHAILETEVDVRFSMVDVIEPEESGKYRWVVSRATA